MAAVADASLLALSMLLCLSLAGGGTFRAAGEAPGDVTFEDVSIAPDPLPVGETLVVGITVVTTSTIEKVQMYYCNDEMCKLPIEMKDEGGGRYSFSIYAEGSEPNPGDPAYSVQDQQKVWVKVGVKTDNGTSYYPTEDTPGYDEGYIKVPIDHGAGDGGDGDEDTDGDGYTDAQEIEAGTDPNDASDHPDGGDGKDGNKKDDKGPLPGFETAVFMTAFLLITGASLLRRRLAG